MTVSLTPALSQWARVDRERATRDFQRNAGKVRLPAGADSNLQRPSVRGLTKA